jgi:DNA-binding Lrp family transcriptional regulator
MADHSLFVFAIVHGEKPDTVGDQLKDSIEEALDIYSIMGEYDLLIRIEHPELAAIQRVVSDKIRTHPNIARTYTMLGYQLYGSKWPGFDYPDSE